MDLTRREFLHGTGTLLVAASCPWRGAGVVGTIIGRALGVAIVLAISCAIADYANRLFEQVEHLPMGAFGRVVPPGKRLATQSAQRLERIESCRVAPGHLA